MDYEQQIYVYCDKNRLSLTIRHHDEIYSYQRIKTLNEQNEH